MGGGRGRQGWSMGAVGPRQGRAREETGTGPEGEIKRKVPTVYVGEGRASRPGCPPQDERTGR